MMCREVIAFLADFLAGELPVDERAEFEAHLAECPWCVAYIQTYQEAVRMGKAVLGAPDEPAAGRAPEELIRAILAARGRAAE
jgi:anti-sigma factor RsiW